MERFLPYMFFLLCPLMHLVMMRFMGGNHNHGPQTAKVEKDERNM